MYETQAKTRELVRRGLLTPHETDLANIEREWGDPKAARACPMAAAGMWQFIYPWAWAAREVDGDGGERYKAPKTTGDSDDDLPTLP